VDYILDISRLITRVQPSEKQKSQFIMQYVLESEDIKLVLTESPTSSPNIQIPSSEIIQTLVSTGRGVTVTQVRKRAKTPSIPLLLDSRTLHDYIRQTPSQHRVNLDNVFQLLFVILSSGTSYDDLRSVNQMKASSTAEFSQVLTELVWINTEVEQSFNLMVQTFLSAKRVREVVRRAGA